VNSPNSKCTLGGSKTVAYVLLKYIGTEPFRKHLRATLKRAGENWPPVDGVFMKNKKNYEALRRFAKHALKNRTDRQ